MPTVLLDKDKIGVGGGEGGGWAAVRVFNRARIQYMICMRVGALCKEITLEKK
jgi:hypothetical protein